MNARADEVLNPESLQIIVLHLKDKVILDGIYDADRTADQKQLSINTVAEILAICGMTFFIRLKPE